MNRAEIERIVRAALEEDLPDITSNAIFPPEERASGHFLVKGSGVLAGVRFAEETFRQIDPSTEFESLLDEGSRVQEGAIPARVRGTVRALLSGERTALNLLQRASGIATATRRYVDAVDGTRARILDTRKTAPGLRTLDKYAVSVGGGLNHRHGLFDMFLLKNNHIDRAGSIAIAMRGVRQSSVKAPIMIEVRNEEELEAAIAERPDYILLDNMTIGQMADAVARTPDGIELEASGGITLDTVVSVAGTGVHRISTGALTHSVRALDISFRIEM